MEYQINIDIDQKGLSNIYGANQAIGLVKSVVTTPLSDGNLPVSWLEFQPLGTNKIQWTQNYYFYASTTVLKAGAKIIMSSQTSVPIQAGWTYTFEAGQFQGQSGEGKTYNLDNQMNNQPHYNFGLAQQANVNNVSTFAPLNAIPILFNQDGTFTPREQISIFLVRYVDNGSVISQVAGNALTVELTSQDPIANVGFDSNTNTFIDKGENDRVLSPQSFAFALSPDQKERVAV